MPGRVIGYTSFVHVPELNSILKIKKGFLIATLSDSFCKENKIDPENLTFDIIKDSKNKIWFAQSNGTGQPGNNLTQLKAEIKC